MSISFKVATSHIFLKVLVSMLLAIGLSGCAVNLPNQQVDLKEGRMEQTGQMIIPRFEPTAIALKDGKVLVFGGQVDTDSADFKLGEIRPNQAEIYDPVTGEFSLTGKINSIRVRHTTTLLQDGRILITGGSIGLITKEEMEIYDSQTGQFSVVGRMKEGREGHQAILLKDGKVLIIGGEEINPKKYRPLGKNQHQIHDTAELFDPQTNQTTLLKRKMHYPRRKHAAVLLEDGRVLIVGGTYKDSGKDFSKEVEIYDPKTKTFSEAGMLQAPRLYPPSLLLLKDGKVLMAGGYSEGYTFLSEAELYDSKVGRFTFIGPMNFERYNAQLIQLDTGKVLVIGGIQAHGQPEEEIELYDPQTRSFKYIGNILRRWYHPSVVKLPGRKVLIVGRATTDKNSVTAELYLY